MINIIHHVVMNCYKDFPDFCLQRLSWVRGVPTPLIIVQRWAIAELYTPHPYAPFWGARPMTPHLFSFPRKFWQGELINKAILHWLYCPTLGYRRVVHAPPIIIPFLGGGARPMIPHLFSFPRKFWQGELINKAILPWLFSYFLLTALI